MPVSIKPPRNVLMRWFPKEHPSIPNLLNSPSRMPLPVLPCANPIPIFHSVLAGLISPVRARSSKIPSRTFPPICMTAFRHFASLARCMNFSAVINLLNALPIAQPDTTPKAISVPALTSSYRSSFPPNTSSRMKLCP